VRLIKNVLAKWAPFRNSRQDPLVDAVTVLCFFLPFMARHEDSDDDTYVRLGAAFEKLETAEDLERAKRKKDKEHYVTDDKGRRRFHGAFTGGFSAGYFNTVGSEEGKLLVKVNLRDPLPLASLRKGCLVTLIARLPECSGFVNQT